MLRGCAFVTRWEPKRLASEKRGASEERCGGVSVCKSPDKSAWRALSSPLPQVPSLHKAYLEAMVERVFSKCTTRLEEKLLKAQPDLHQHNPSPLA